MQIDTRLSPSIFGEPGNEAKTHLCTQFIQLFTSHRCDQLTGDAPGEAEAWASAGLFEHS